jgi:transporter family protein
MQLSTFLFALAATCCYGIAPIFGKTALTRVDPSVGLLVRTFAVSLTLLIWAILSHQITRIPSVDLRSTGFLVLEGLAGGLGGTLFYYLALKYAETTRITAITSAFPVIAFLGAILFLSEKPTLDKLIGLALIVLGVIIIRR